MSSLGSAAVFRSEDAYSIVRRFEGKQMLRGLCHAAASLFSAAFREPHGRVSLGGPRSMGVLQKKKHGA